MSLSLQESIFFWDAIPASLENNVRVTYTDATEQSLQDRAVAFRHPNEANTSMYKLAPLSFAESPMPVLALLQSRGLKKAV